MSISYPNISYPSRQDAARCLSMANDHEELKKTRGRGEDAQNHLARVRHLKLMEAELKSIRHHLDEAWIWLDGSRDFRKTMRHADHAQQRLHRVIKKISRRVK